MRIRNSLWCFTWVALVSFAAWAQEPPPPEAPTSSPVYGSPGTSGKAAGSGDYEVINPSEGAGTAEIPMEEAPAADVGTAPAAGRAGVPGSYSIQQGDTLWDICQKLLDNPWYWPKLWSLNEYITNPHEIYPGNRLVFFPGSETAPPRMDVVRAGEPAAPAAAPPPAALPGEAAPKEGEMLFDASVFSKSSKVKLRPEVFLIEEDLKSVGKISHSGEPKINLVEGDKVYLAFKKGTAVSVGDTFDVVDVIKKVKKLGHLVRVKAVLRVTAVRKETVDAYVADANDSVSRGDLVVAHRPLIHEVTPRETDKVFEGKIVEVDHEQKMISNQDFVFVNLGKKHGVEEGLQLYVVRRGDAVFPGDDKHLPDVVFGRLLVVRANQNSSMAYVTDLKDDLTIGDRVRSRPE